MAATPVLYSFRRCPYAIRARLALAISGIAVDIVEVALRDKPAALIAASAKATVPVLVLADGRVIDESLDIMRWALGQDDPEAWLAGDDPVAIAVNDGALKRQLDLYKYADPTDRDGPRNAALTLLLPLEARLTRHANLKFERRTLIDMALLPFVRQFAQVDRAWFDARPLPGLQRWLAHHLASLLFESVMARPIVASRESARPTQR